MANIDIFDNFENYLENKKFRAFLYTPSNQLVRELEMINPVLSLIKVGFNTLEFQLPAKIFDLGTLSLSSNDTIDYALDGYEVEVWVGDLTKVDAYDIYRFIVKGRPSSMVDEKPVFSYSAISSEWELQKLPIINWPGIEKMAYKQTSRPYQSQPQTGDPENSNPQLTNQTAQGDIKLVKKPKDGTVVVTRIHTEYGVEIPLFETNFEDSSGMSEGEYHIYKFQNEYFLTAYVPANIKLPIDNAGTVRWNDPIDEYQFFIYYETDDEVFQEDLDIEITDEPHYSTFEEEPYFSKDGLTINEIVEDLFKNLESEDSNMKNFLGWTYSETSTQITDIRSGLSFETTNLYEILKSLQENYQVYIDYDTVNRVVKILPDDFGTNNGLRFEYGKYLKGINQDFNVDEQVNYVQGKDANGIGFADVSWSGDNYLENYTYQLDGVEWSPNPAPTVTGLPSRWLSDGLATELAKRKYYQEFYREEVWGASSLADSITKRRFDLQEQLTRKQFELEQIEAAIKQKDGLIEAYNNETDPQVKINLDVTSRNTAYLIPVTTEANTTKISLNDEVIRLTEVDQIATKTFSINFHKRLVRSFKIEGGPNSNWTNNLLVYGLSKLFKENIKIIFKDEGTPIKEIFFTISGISRDGNLINLFDKLIDLNELIEADEISIEASVKVLKLITNMPSIIFKNIYLYTVDDENEGIRAWKTFVERQNYLKQNLETQQSQKIIEIGKISNEVKLDFDPEQPFDTNKIYSLSELEQRLDYIRTFTSIDYNSLSEPQKIELKRIRRGQVYENTDIIDSKTLFEASEKFLLENINPSITIDIDSISILQAYEAQSDWHKVRIGEKVDIFVPDLKISIEAEIVEMSIDFQNYATALKIATTKNYDKRFGKYFANVYTLLQNTFQNIIKPTQKPNEGAVVFIEDKKDLIESNLSGGPVNIGSSTGDGESNNTQNQPSILALGTVVINPLTEQLVTTPPPELFPIYGNLIIGTAKITNGGFYIKDQNDNLRVALNAKDGFIGYKQNSETGDTEETFKIDLAGNATFAGELKAASGTFGEVEIAENGSLTVGNITINQAGIIAVSDLANPTTTQTLFIDSSNGDVFIRGTIQEGTTFEDALTRQINVSGGTRIINYDADDTLPDGQEPDEIMGTFTANVFRNGQNISDPNVYNVQYSWAVEGLLTLDSDGDDVDDIATTNRTFTPAIKTTYTNDPTQIILTVTYPDNQQIVEIIPINITKDGIQGVNGYNQAQIYIYKRVSGTAPTDVGTITGLYNFEDAAFSSQTPFSSSAGWTVTIPSGTDPLYISIGTVSSQQASVSVTQSDFSTPVKLVENGANGTAGLNSIAVELTNDVDVVPSQQDGTSPVLTGTGGFIRLYDGPTPITSGVTYSGTATKNKLVLTVDSSTGAYTLANASGQEWDSFIETFILSATYNSITYDKIYTISKARGGLDGDNALIRKIELSSPVITKEATDAATDGTYSDVIIFGKQYNGTVESNYGYITYQENGGSESSRIDVSSGGYTLSTASNSNISSYTIKLYAAATGGSAIDTETISVVFKGDPGQTGPAGKKAVSGIVYYTGSDACNLVAKPSDTNYDISTNEFSTALPTDWSINPPTFSAASGDTYCYSRFSGIEGETGNIALVSFTTPASAINFEGLVTFTDNGSGGVVNNQLSNITSIQGGLLSTAKIDSSEVIPNTTSPKMTIALNDQFISIGQEVQGYDKVGVFLGYDSINDVGQLSLVSDGNHLKWTGDTLDLQGDLGGTIGQISIVGDDPNKGIIIDEDGITGYTDFDGDVFSFKLNNEGDLTLTGNITATGGDIGGWKIQKSTSGSSGIFSGNAFLNDSSFGTEGQLTISSDGYISGPNFRINKSGGALFNNLTAKGTVDLADIRRTLTTLSVSTDAINQVVLNTNNCQFGSCTTLLKTINISTRDIDFITISKLIDVSDLIVAGITYSIDIVGGLGNIQFAGQISEDTIFNFSSTLKSRTAISISINHLSTDAGKTVKIRNHIKSSTMSKLRITNIDDIAVPATSDTILIIDQDSGETVKRGPEFSTSVNDRTRFLRNDGTWQTPAIFGTPDYGCAGGVIDTSYSSFYRIAVSSSGSIGPLLVGTYMYIFTGFVTVSNNTGTATIELPISLTKGTVQATVASDDSGGAGVDSIYGLMSSSSTNQFKIIKDFTGVGGNNSNAAHFTVTGYAIIAG